jgi:hypothetical protein
MLSRPFYGVVLAPTIVLAAYGGTHVSPEHLIRPLGVMTLLAAISFVLVGAATRRWHAAAFVTALALLALIGDVVLYFLLALAWTIMAWRSVRQRGSLGVSPQLTRPLNAVVATWLGIALVTAVAASVPGDLPAIAPLEVAPGPNVYLILLDGYPRHDSLMEYFGFDNSPFLDALEERGFEVSERSGSDYRSTILVVPSMLHARPVEELLGGLWHGTDAQHRRLWRLLNQAPVTEAFDDAGFETYAIVSPAAGLDWRTADVVQESPWLTSFERNLVKRGALQGIIPLDAMHRATILDAFTFLEESAGVTQRFVFAHIMSPHDPYVFAADGGPADPCGNECLNHTGPPNAMLADRFISQLRFINGRVIQAVDRIIEADPDGTVIVFSDHGLRRDPADPDEWLRTLFAARGHSFPEDVTPLRIFPVLMSQEDGRAGQ